MSTFPETLGLGQVISRELKEEIEHRYNTYAELEQQHERDVATLKSWDAALTELQREVMMLREALSATGPAVCRTSRAGASPFRSDPQ